MPVMKFLPGIGMMPSQKAPSRFVKYRSSNTLFNVKLKPHFFNWYCNEKLTG